MSSIEGMRADLIKKFRRQINEKTYVVKSQEIASKMAKELFNAKSNTQSARLKA